MFEIAAEAGRSPEVTTPSEREIVVAHVFDSPRDAVFDAFTKPELITRWMFGPQGWSMPVCDVDLQIGGTFRYAWHNDADALEFGVDGVYLDIARPDRIVRVERFNGYPSETLVKTTFVARDHSTVVTVTSLYESRQIR